MSWFHFTKQDRLQRNRTIRRELAEDSYRDAAENVFLINKHVTEALNLAMSEERTFEDYLGEPMPSHVQGALHLEIVLWRRIQAALERVDTRGITDEAYKTFTDNIKIVLLALNNLLHAEEEMIKSCLVQHYVNILHSVQSDAARASL